MKKGPLNKKEKAYIEKYQGKVSSTKMAKHLDRSVEVVDKFVATIEPEVVVVETVVSTEPQMPKIMDIMAKRKDFGVVIMTEAASMAADKAKETRKPKEPSGRYKNCIMKIREEE